MLKKTITYTDFDGNERTEDFYFNISKAELAMMNLSKAGGLEKWLSKVVATQDTPTLAELFRDIIRKAYGEKSDDGRRFIKSDELSDAFEQTNAYSELVIELLGDPKKAAAFMNQVMPSDLRDAVAKMPGAVESAQ